MPHRCSEQGGVRGVRREILVGWAGLASNVGDFLAPASRGGDTLRAGRWWRGEIVNCEKLER